jgi:hypothetical protein
LRYSISKHSTARVLSDVYRRDAAAAINENTGSRSSSRLEKLFTEISIHYEQALASQREPGDAALEYLKIAAAFATSTQKRRIVEICSMGVNHGMSAVAAIEATGSLSAAVQVRASYTFHNDSIHILIAGVSYRVKLRHCTPRGVG